MTQYEREDACTPSVDEARRMGEKGSDTVEGERLAFEAWLAGHCWSLEGAKWDGNCYRGDDETMGRVSVSLPAIGIRRMWAAWRDRAALARLKTPNVGSNRPWPQQEQR